ncbi:MAG: LysE family transporter [Rhizomicrobium sp.]|jgi:threonine/homoserine/homoserine lactone efflux protein
MEYLLLIVSGVVIGFIVAAPIGPVNLICIRRTLSFGPVNGIVAGFGAALGDGIFAAVTAFGITAVSGLIRGHSTMLQIVGGVLLMFFGISTYISDPLHGRGVEKAAARPVSGGSLVRTFASTFALTITNPVTLFAFAALFAGLTGIAKSDATFVNAGLLVSGVFAGAMLWWFTLTTVVGFLHARIDARVMRIINHGSGIAVAFFGIGVLFRLLVSQFY